MKNNFLKLILLTIFLWSLPAFVLALDASPQLNVKIGGSEFEFSTPTNCGSGEVCNVGWIGEYVAVLYQYGVGIAGFLAVLMIMIGGFIWLVSAGSPGRISQAKDFITSALLGLLLALFSFVILLVVNPRLVNLDSVGLQVGEAPTVTARPDITGILTPAGGGSTGGGGATPTSVPREDFVTGDRADQYVQDFAAGLSDSNTLTSVIVDTNARTATFIDASGHSTEVPVNIGVGGTSAVGAGVQGDRRTPTGSFQVTDDVRISQDGSTSVMTNDGSTNLGSAFIGINAVDQNGSYRGIGFHGSQENGLRPTYGCIRMTNDDLNFLAEHMTPGTVVTIN